MTTREALHQEIDRLPDGAVETLSLALARLREDPFKFMLDNAPYDDEPVSEAQRAAIDAARASTAPHFTSEQVGALLEVLA